MSEDFPLPAYVSTSKGRTVLDVYVQPGAATDSLQGRHGDALKARVKAPPVEGRANAAVERLVAGALGVPPSAVAVIAGGGGRAKRVVIEGLTAPEVADRLGDRD